MVPTRQTDDRFAFEEFPRDDITFQFSRREFWSVIVGNVAALHKKGQGTPAYSLANLGSWPDERLVPLMPFVVPGCCIAMHDGFIWGQPSATRPPVKLFPDDSPALSAFNLFNGTVTLGGVSYHLKEITGWDEQRSFAYVRGLFLSLVLAGICQPRA